MKPGRSFPYTPTKFCGHFSIGPSDMGAQSNCLTRPSISGAAADFFTSTALGIMAATQLSDLLSSPEAWLTCNAYVAGDPNGSLSSTGLQDIARVSGLYSCCQLVPDGINDIACICAGRRPCFSHRRKVSRGTRIPALVVMLQLRVARRHLWNYPRPNRCGIIIAIDHTRSTHHKRLVWAGVGATPCACPK